MIITGIDCKNCTYYKKLQELEKENKMLKRYKFLFEKARELKEKTDKWAQKCLAENEDLKDSLKKTVCQAECFKHKEAIKYKSALEEVEQEANKKIYGNEGRFYTSADYMTAICEIKTIASEALSL